MRTPKFWFSNNFAFISRKRASTSTSDTVKSSTWGLPMSVKWKRKGTFICISREFVNSLVPAASLLPGARIYGHVKLVGSYALFCHEKITIIPNSTYSTPWLDICWIFTQKYTILGSLFYTYQTRSHELLNISNGNNSWQLTQMPGQTPNGIFA